MSLAFLFSYFSLFSYCQLNIVDIASRSSSLTSPTQCKETGRLTSGLFSIGDLTRQGMPRVQLQVCLALPPGHLDFWFPYQHQDHLPLGSSQGMTISGGGYKNSTGVA